MCEWPERGVNAGAVCACHLSYWRFILSVFCLDPNTGPSSFFTGLRKVEPVGSSTILRVASYICDIQVCIIYTSLYLAEVFCLFSCGATSREGENGGPVDNADGKVFLVV